uniref:Uncharacterized protein n=1 Tax=Arundo donax TaxID=35708 RepID=A0A0A9FXL1_ARUDO
MLRRYWMGTGPVMPTSPKYTDGAKHDMLKKCTTSAECMNLFE